jgi:hypothetical protein
MQLYYTITDPEQNITRIKINSNVPSEKELDDYTKLLGGLFRKSFPHVILLDITDGKYLTAEQRIQLGKVVKDNTDALRSTCKGVAIINKSVISNIVLNGIFLVSPLPVISKTFTEGADASSWAKQQLLQSAYSY